MNDDADLIIERLRTTPPRCVRGFQLTPAELPKRWDDNPKSVWRVACTCGHPVGKLLAHPLDQCTHDPAHKTIYISPIAFQCGACQKEAELFDTDEHGYHAEIGKFEAGETGATKYRGTGAREAWRCPDCGQELFELIVAFVYWPAAIDLFLDEPEHPAEDFFNVFLCYCCCAGCGQRSQPCDFGKL